MVFELAFNYIVHLEGAFLHDRKGLKGSWSVLISQLVHLRLMRVNRMLSQLVKAHAMVLADLKSIG